jgi:predicted phage terminase large subunit-like protein
MSRPRKEVEISPQIAARELLRRKRMRESIIGFSENIDIPGAPLSPDDDTLFLPIGSSTADHHYLLMEALQETMLKEYGRLMVFMPPGSAKSTYCTVVAPTWFMGKFPGSEIILASHNVDLAKHHGSRGRNIVQQPLYMDAFNGTISKGSSAKENWDLTNGSQYKSFGLLGGATGFRADGLVIDDPVRGRADASSKTVQEKTFSAYKDDLLTRLKPKAWVVLVQTRWDYADLAGRILPKDWNGESGYIMCRDGMMWRVICLPAKIEDGFPDDPLGRKTGEYLWPEWFDERHWLQFEPRPNDDDSPDEKSWWSLFQQRPRPDTGNQWEAEWTQWYDLGKHPRHLMLFSASDYAVSDEYEEGGDPDYTEHYIGGLDEHGDLWVIDCWYGRHTPDITIDALLKMAKRRGVRNGYSETGLIRKAIEPQFKARQRIFKHHMAMKYLPTIGNKVARFQSFRGLGAAGKVHIPNCPWGHRLQDQLCDFPSPRTHDDGVDCMSLFGRALDNMIWSREKVTRPVKRGVKFGSVEWLMLGTEDGGTEYGDNIT